MAPVGPHPDDIVADAVAAHLDASMVGVGRDMLRLRLVQQVVGEPGRHLVMLHRPVLLQRE
jgi:hypothetical protein